MIRTGEIEYDNDPRMERFLKQIKMEEKALRPILERNRLNYKNWDFVKGNMKEHDRMYEESRNYFEKSDNDQNN